MSFLPLIPATSPFVENCGPAPVSVRWSSWSILVAGRSSTRRYAPPRRWRSRWSRSEAIYGPGPALLVHSLQPFSPGPTACRFFAPRFCPSPNGGVDAARPDDATMKPTGSFGTNHPHDRRPLPGIPAYGVG